MKRFRVLYVYNDAEAENMTREYQTFRHAETHEDAIKSVLFDLEGEDITVMYVEEIAE